MKNSSKLLIAMLLLPTSRLFAPRGAPKAIDTTKPVAATKVVDPSDVLLRAVTDYTTLDTVIDLLKEGAKINAKDKNGNTPLMIAISASLDDMPTGNSRLLKQNHLVSVLLANGAQVNDQNNDGNTALHLAVKERNNDIIATLFERADLDTTIKNNDKKTAYDIANKETRALLDKVMSSKADSKAAEEQPR
ncbi:MAG: ankyrin repeat domain-containing protein [Candidatus Dependentiae bacterium]|nr:ankyrin repeat domain-containing protein [Candidatus Dependentiae bacterium]